MLAILLSFMLMGGLRAMATPLVDNQGGSPDEVFHFARSLEKARLLAEGFGLPAPRFSASELTELGTRGDDLCGLGIGGIQHCKPNIGKMPSGSGEIRGSGVYLLHGLAQLLLPVSDTQSRLLFGRVAALGVGLALALVAYQLGCLLFDDRKIAVAAAALVVLLPSVGVIMSALSTEGPALLAVALLLWMAVSVCLCGFSGRNLVGLCLGVLACAFTKITALAALPVAGLLLMHRAGFRWRGMLLAGSVGIAALMAWIGITSSTPAGVAHWYFERAPAMVPIHGQAAALASQFNGNEDDSIAALGRMAILTGDTSSTALDQSVVQFLPGRLARRLAGKRLSVGAWITAPMGSLIHAPEVLLATDTSLRSLLPDKVWVASGEWQFVADEVQLSAHVPTAVGVRLNTNRHEVLHDGVILAVGSYVDAGQPPAYDDAAANSGEWGGARFVNLLKNGSGEATWNGVPPSLRVFVSRFGTGTLANRLNGQLFSIYDFERTGAGYLSGLRAIFVTFWGSFVGGDWPGLARWHYVVVAGVLVLAGLGWVRRMWSSHTFPEAMPVHVAFAFLLAVFLYLVIGVARMEVSAEWTPPLFYATARHVLPAIIPTVFLTVGGLAQLLSRRVNRVVLASLIACVFLASTWMLLRVELPYFTCPLEVHWECTAL